MKAPFVAAGIAALSLVASSAAAEARPSGHLVLQEHPKAACITETSLRQAVAERLGYDPFDPSSTGNVGKTEVRVDLSESANKLRAEVTVGSARRELTTPLTKCPELRSSVALTLAVLFEEAPPPPAPPQDPPPATPLPEAKAPVVVPAPAPPAKAEAAAPHATYALVALTGHVARLPRPFVGAMVGLGLARERWSIAAEVAIDPGVSSPNESPSPFVVGGVTAALYAGSIVPCVRRWLLAACARVSAGALVSQTTGIAGFALTTEDHTLFYLALGARAELAVPLPVTLAGGLDFLAALDADAPILGKTVTLGGQPLWSMPAVGAAVRLGARLRF